MSKNRDWLMNLDSLERRRCNECGEEWTDDGGVLCPFCDSDDTEFVEEEQ